MQNKILINTPHNVSSDWPERIQKAIQAREAGKKVREGKPVGFKQNYFVSLGGQLNRDS